MDRPPSHHPDCTCETDDADQRTVSASNYLITEAAQISAGHQLCSHNMLVAAYFLVEYMRDVCEAQAGGEIDRKASEIAKNFYQYSSDSHAASIRRNQN